MKRLIAVLIPVLMVVGGAYATGTTPTPTPNPVNTQIGIENNIDNTQYQNVSLDGGGDSSSTAYGGNSKSDAASSSGASISTTSVANYQTRTQPLNVFPPYLPHWNHGGWGTVKAYFPNGPNSDEQIYERAFDPDDDSDMRDLRGVIEAMSYEGPLETLGGILNGVGVIFGGPDNYHHGRGLEISSSLVRTRRPNEKPLLIFIDTNVDTNLLRQAGYAYVGKVSLEGKVDRNWDQVYDAAVAETLPWDVDILLISGGMKGVTVGSNTSFPGAAGGYSQANHSLSLFGSVSSGITEGKGKALVSAQGYRFWPKAAQRRRIPQAFYNKIRAQLSPRITDPTMQRQSGVRVQRQAVPAPTMQRQSSVGTARQTAPVTRRRPTPGVEISQELYDMAGFSEDQRIENLVIK
ncbi:hypothetical protein ACFL5F_03505 [Planctomycetota bacterium]